MAKMIHMATSTRRQCGANKYITLCSIFRLPRTLDDIWAQPSHPLSMRGYWIHMRCCCTFQIEHPNAINELRTHFFLLSVVCLFVFSPCVRCLCACWLLCRFLCVIPTHTADQTHLRRATCSIYVIFQRNGRKFCRRDVWQRFRYTCAIICVGERGRAMRLRSIFVRFEALLYIFITIISFISPSPLQIAIIIIIIVSRERWWSYICHLEYSSSYFRFRYKYVPSSIDGRAIASCGSRFSFRIFFFCCLLRWFYFAHVHTVTGNVT